MTDIAILKSRIAEFAGQDPAPASCQSDWVPHLLSALHGHAFDALHLRGGQVEAKFGQAQDMIPHTAELFGADLTEARAFVCAADHDPDMLLFGATQENEAIILRSRSIPLNHIMALWRATLA